LTTGETIAQIEIINFNKSEWKFDMRNMNYKQDFTKITFLGHKYASGMKSILSRNCDFYDELVIKVNYQQISRNWGNICVFVHNKYKNSIDTGYWGIGRFCNGSFFLINDKLTSKDLEKITKYDSNHNYYSLKLINNQGNIELFLQFEDSEWKFIKTYNLQEEASNLEIGILVNVGENQYYNWLFSNYIQLRKNKEILFPIEYDVHPMKSWKYYTLNPFINFSIERKTNINKSEVSIIEYLKRNIFLHRYIEIRLDEIFCVGSLAYEKQSHRFHEILIYGYTDIHSLFYAMGFYYGKMKKFQITYENILIAISDEKVTNLTLLEYSLDGYQFKFNPIVIKESIDDYINGKDSSLKFANLLPVKENIAGIQIYDEFLKDSDSLNEVKNNVQISYILYEHKKLMVERINFMLYRNIITSDEIENIHECFKSLYKISSVLNILIVRNQIKCIPQIDDKIKNYLTEMKTIELKCMKDLYILLDSKFK
jgi:regulation of enolase protein 1 (concanavalin A-like superfamily)